MQLSCVVLSLVLTAAAVLALPSGAPSCVLGSPNPQSLHLASERNPVTGQIQVGGFDVFINDVKLAFKQGEENLFEFDSESDQKLTIKADNGTFFKGMLLLLSKDGTDATPALKPRDSFKLATGCTGTAVVGVTHSENSEKTVGDSTLRWDKDGDVFTLDVNIVVQNNGELGSYYYYSQYKLKAVDRSPPAPTAAPSTKRCGFICKLLRLFRQ